jgi:hypothetical protein
MSYWEGLYHSRQQRVANASELLLSIPVGSLATLEEPKDSLTSRYERWAAGAAFFLYLVFQINASLHHGSMGQDFAVHRGWVVDALANPWHFLTHFGEGRTNPPLFHLFCALVYQWTGYNHPLEVIALLCTLINAGALLLLYKVIREIVASPVLRVSCIVFVLFLPAVMIHAIVLASDALATPIFIVAMYLLTRLVRPQSTGLFVVRCAALACTLILGLGVKFTFGAVVFGILISTLLMQRTGLLPKRRFTTAMAIAVCLPAATALMEYLAYSHQQTYNNGVNKTGSEMSVRSIVFFRAADSHVLMAPPYDEKGEPQPASGDTPAFHENLLVKNKFSYPALLHLSIFTDVMNIYQYDPLDGYFGPRSPANQARMQLAVRTGVIFFFGTAILAAFLLWRSARSIWLHKAELVPVAMLGICGGLWFLNIAAGLPFVRAYYMGFWLARLVIPALLSFIVIAFAGADRLLRGHAKAWAWSILCLAVMQSVLHASFLWPWENTSVQLLRPEPGTVISRPQVQFVWMPATNAEDYWVDVGTEPARGDIWAGYTHGLPNVTADVSRYLNGRKLYLQIYTKHAGMKLAPGSGARFEFFTAPEQGEHSWLRLISPQAGTILTGSSLALKWTEAPGAEDYVVDVGTSPAQGDIWNGYTKGHPYITVDLKDRADGRKVYVQLYAKYPGVNLVAGTGAKFEFQTAKKP